VAVLIAVGSALALAAKPSRPKTKRVAAAPIAPVAGRIVYVGEGANLYVCNAACDKPTCLTCAARKENAFTQTLRLAGLGGVDQPGAGSIIKYELPTFSPDGSQIAYASAQRGGDSPYSINTYDLDRRAATTIFQSSDRPIYFFWMPEGHRLFFLAGDEEGLKLMLAQAREMRPVRVLLSGLPLFFDWDQRLNQIAFHYAPPEDDGPEQIGLMSVTDHDQKVVKVIAKGKAPFRSPAWSPDGSHLAYVLDSRNGQFGLMVAKADGSGAKAMVGLGPLVSAFLWAPDSRHIAFSTLREAGKMSYDGINLLDIATGNITVLVSDPVIAYSFSPDGKSLAYIGTTETSNTWNIIAAGGGQPRKLCDFVASSSESAAYQVFDQYALSHRIWSPDSHAIVFAGVMVNQGQSPSQTMPPPSVWVMPIDGSPPHALADGTIAFWSPR
jgi:TolB protein